MINADDVFDVLADTTRRRMLALLMAEDELSVAELCYAIDCSQPKASRHLAKLRDARVVSVRRDRVWKHYRLHPQLPAWAFQVLQTMTHSGEQASMLGRDLNRLATMPDRPIGAEHARATPQSTNVEYLPVRAAPATPNSVTPAPTV
ncbi:ArsR family transcriptional regulator [Chitinivorax tropicus]|uniref:ArsR family transcriptional regulator n=1 Tax=Chitinivorax tropicus TaxID=714531 RepID=A0A840MCJ4_9PROT|nr:metalloregulator ArsR/SmtB family transcription factor [Chitinivorax tropicus]MBB5017034.1 ArsR family transcriptional regulator [Chitinivorax tropicus]